MAFLSSVWLTLLQHWRAKMQEVGTYCAPVSDDDVIWYHIKTKLSAGTRLYATTLFTLPF
jgi:hypothetical protein